MKMVYRQIVPDSRVSWAHLRTGWFAGSIKRAHSSFPRMYCSSRTHIYIQHARGVTTSLTSSRNSNINYDFRIPEEAFVNVATNKMRHCSTLKQNGHTILDESQAILQEIQTGTQDKDTLTFRKGTSTTLSFNTTRKRPALRIRAPEEILNDVLEKRELHAREIISTFKQLAQYPGHSRRLLRHLQALNHPQVNTFYKYVLSSHKTGGQLQDALSLVDEMQFRGYKPTADTYVSMVTGLGKSSEDVVSLAHTLEKRIIGLGERPPDYFYRVIVKSLKLRHESRKALSLLHTLEWPGHSKNEYKKQLKSAYHGILVDLVSPDVVGHKRTCELRASSVYTRYVAVLDEMTKEGIEPVSYTYQLIFSKLQDWQVDRAQVAKLLEDHMLSTASITPDAACYDSILRVYKYTNEWRRALRVLRSIQQNGHPVLLWHYNGVLATLRKTGDVEVALRLMGEMSTYAITPDRATYRHAIGTCFLHAERNWETAVDLHNKTPKPDALVYERTIGVCGAAGQVEAALKLFAQMQEKGLEPTQRAYDGLMRMFALKGMYVEARQMLEEFKQRDAQTHTDIAEKRYRFVDHKNYRSVIRACINGGAYDKAIDAFTEMKGENLTPGSGEYDDVIIACGKAGRWQLGMELMREMARAGVRHLGEKEASVEDLRILEDQLHGAKTMNTGNATGMRVFQENGLDRASEQLYTHLTAEGNEFFRAWNKLYRTGVLDAHDHTLAMVPQLVNHALRTLREQYTHTYRGTAGEVNAEVDRQRMSPLVKILAGLGTRSDAKGAQLGHCIEAELLRQTPPIHCIAHRLGELVPEPMDVQRWLESNP